MITSSTKAHGRIELDAYEVSDYEVGISKVNGSLLNEVHEKDIDGLKTFTRCLISVEGCLNA